MKDIGHEETEAILKTLERRINREYRQAIEEVQETLDDYLRRFETKDKIWQKWVEDGDKTQRQYNDWRIGQMAIGRRWEEQKEAIAAELTQATEMAKQIAYDTMPNVYAANHDWAAYEVEKGTQLDTEYTLMSRDTAAGILKDRKLYHDPGEETIRRIAEGEEMRWNKKQIQSVMLQGILQGESIPKMATRLATTVGDRDRKASIRNARTMTTGVENAGRVDSYKRAQKMGINTRQQWMATLDGRTRHSHRVLDGEIVDVGKEFSNGCRFPGDPSGPAGEIYNCRCTLIAALKGFERDLSDTSLRRDEKLGDMSYAEWKKAKATSKKITAQEEFGRAIEQQEIQRYRHGEAVFEPKGKIADLVEHIGNKRSKNVVRQATGALRQRPLSIEDALMGANPHYGESAAYMDNCQRAVQAYEFRRRGYQVEALGYVKNSKVRYGSECFIEGKVTKRSARDAFTWNCDRDMITSTLNNANDGSRYAIYFKWPNSDDAHVFIAEKENGIVRYLDPQSGENNVARYMHEGQNGTFGIFRMDNKKITKDVEIIHATVKRSTV